MRIGLAGREDLTSILEISNWAAAHTSANFATEPESRAAWGAMWEATHATHPWLIASDDSGVIGFAKAAPHRSRGAYAWTAEVSVYIRADRHRRGIARALYRRLLPMLRAQGFVTLLAGIVAEHGASERLHAAFGFQPCGVFHRAGWKLGRWHDVGYWELQLQPAGVAPTPTKPVAEVWPAELRTERLHLRRWRDADLAPFAALNADAEVMAHFPAPLSTVDSDALAGRIRSALAERGYGPWAVEIPGVTAFAGFIGLASPAYDTPFTPCVEVGWRLARAYWGRGYATEGARAALAFAFDQLGLDEVVSFTVPGNLPSRRVMEKLGMTRRPDEDFDHPRVPDGHPLKRHVLYRLRRPG